MKRFEGRTTVVTGATGGLGGATCHRIADEGGALIVTDIRDDDCRELIAGLPHPERHRSRSLDVTDEDDWRSLAAWLVAGSVPLHALVNNAGIGSLAGICDETVEGWESVLKVDQTGVWLGMKHLGPLLDGEQPGGAIVNVSSILGTVGGYGDNFAYHAAKGAVRTMTKSAAMHFAASGVRVNSIHPGYVATANLVREYAGTVHHERMITNTPMGRLAEPAEIAAAIAFLAGSDSSYMTGAELYVDGGFTAR